MNIQQRKEYLNTITKRVDGKPYSWSELSLGIEGRHTNLRIWLGNEKSISEGCGKTMVYIRLDKYQAYSTPLDTEKAKYLDKVNPCIERLLEFYVFGKTDVTDLDKVLQCVEPMKERQLLSW